jgi:hypothetical protein
MKTWACTIAAFVLVLGLVPAGVARPTAVHADAIPLAVSTFDSNAEGWAVIGNGVGTPTYQATGGNPGGYVSATDQTDDTTWFWSAPAKFLGNKSAAYGGVLRFDLRQDSIDAQFQEYDVILDGAGLRLVLEATYTPRTSWTSYIVILDERAGWFKDGTNNPPTAGEMQAVLADLTALRIRGEYRDGNDTGGLENVRLEGPSSPAWQMLAGPTAIYLAGRTDVTIPLFGDDLTGFPLWRNCTVLPCYNVLLEQFPLFQPAVGGMRFIFRATGGVDYYGDPHGKTGPDGWPETESAIVALGGISGYSGPHGSLVGVFLDAANPKDGTPPDPLENNTSFSTLSPALGQVFFIGDGLTGTGTGVPQTFFAPAGATRLFLGIADAMSFGGEPGWYDDNYGSFWVQVILYKIYLPLTIK